LDLDLILLKALKIFPRVLIARKCFVIKTFEKEPAQESMIA